MGILGLQWEIFVKVYFLLSLCNKSYEVVVHTKWGPVRGYELENEPNVYAFRNIPYAKQPVGDLRFELPREVEPWSSKDELNQRKKIHCPQFSSDIGEKVLGQENCLFLDIYSNKAEKLESCCFPVLVYFHGGKFSRGSKEEYGSDFLLKYNKFILVMPNYRLGILGFLSTQDSILPGNLGLWDQRMALKWVAETIQAFGGDPHQITIAGHGAGGASVGFHILSPLSHNYFSAAISSSGTALDPWVMTNEPSPSAIEVAKGLKCLSNSSNDLVTCLKHHHLEDILQVQEKLKHVTFLPVKDETAEVPFIPADPRILYEKGYQKNVSYLAGVTENRAALQVS
ncbi:esterase SG1-like, partial [Stegodyphus dumicola]|uniref:esterase SG1-like n=1 Tax=Stegodyphus dumicola TaxID=202533 RepID=UPI0015B0E17C